MTNRPVIVVENDPFPRLLQAFLDPAPMPGRDALASGHLGGLGLDTFYEEPGRADDPLLEFDNAIITPRIAAQPRFNALGDLAELIAGLSRTLGGSP